MVLVLSAIFNLAIIGTIIAAELSATMEPIIKAAISGRPSVQCAANATTSPANTKHTVVSKSPCPTAPRKEETLKSIPLLNSTTIRASVVKISPAEPNISGVTTCNPGPIIMPKTIKGKTSGRRVFSNKKENICPKNSTEPINRMA